MPQTCGIDAIDPTRTSASISCCSSEAGFSPFQKANLNGYYGLSRAWRQACDGGNFSAL